MIDSKSLIGVVFDGWELIELIGSGSFAVVFKAQKGDVVAAAKCLRKEGLSQSQLKMQKLEAECLTRLVHPNVVLLLATYEDELYDILFQEYCEQDLFDYLKEHPNPSFEDSKNLFCQLCDAVAYCHSKSVYHRDLKPENILLSNGQIKLADFGLATTKEISDELGCGSLRYMSPEALCKNTSIGTYSSTSSTNSLRKHSYLTEKNDVWALAVILINILTSKNPWISPKNSDKHFKMHLISNRRGRPDSFASQFSFSPRLCAILRTVFTLSPSLRPSVETFRQMIYEFDYPFIEPRRSSWPIAQSWPNSYSPNKAGIPYQLTPKSNDSSNFLAVKKTDVNEGFASYSSSLDSSANIFNRSALTEDGTTGMIFNLDTFNDDIENRLPEPMKNVEKSSRPELPSPHFFIVTPPDHSTPQMSTLNYHHKCSSKNSHHTHEAKPQSITPKRLSSGNPNSNVFLKPSTSQPRNNNNFLSTHSLSNRRFSCIFLQNMDSLADVKIVEETENSM